MEKKYLYECVSEETAHVVENWPWGYQYRTQARFWIESNPKGSRMWQRTQNPKTGFWCKAKATTYSPVQILMIDAEGKISYACLGRGSDYEDVKKFREKHYPHLDPQRRLNLIEAEAWADTMKDVKFEVVRSEVGPINISAAMAGDKAELEKMEAQKSRSEERKKEQERVWNTLAKRAYLKTRDLENQLA